MLAAFAQHVVDEAELHQEQYLLWQLGIWSPVKSPFLD
jgi:hypothetical protein